PDSRWWTGPALALAAVGALTAAAVAADHAAGALGRYSFGWRQVVAAVLAMSALTGTVTAGLSWVTRGAAHPLTGHDQQALPVFAAAQLSAPTSPRVLVLRRGDGVRFALLGSPAGLRLGDADVVATDEDAADRALAAVVQRIVAGEATAVPELARFGVSMVVTST